MKARRKLNTAQLRQRSENEWNALHGLTPDRFFSTWQFDDIEHERESWNKLGESVLAEFIAERPGQRPAAWYRHDPIGKRIAAAASKVREPPDPHFAYRAIEDAIANTDIGDDLTKHSSWLPGEKRAHAEWLQALADQEAQERINLPWRYPDSHTNNRRNGVTK